MPVVLLCASSAPAGQLWPVVAFGSGPGGCALGWDSGWLLGVCLLPLAPLQVRASLYWAPLTPLLLLFFEQIAVRAMPGLFGHTAAGLHKPLLVSSGAVGARICSRSLLVPPSPACAAVLPPLGQCVGVRASWRNDWQAA